MLYDTSLGLVWAIFFLVDSATPYLALASVVGSVLFIFSARKKSDHAVTNSEKLQLWVISLCNPIFSGIVLYLGLRERLPSIQKQAARITLYSFGIWLGYFVLYWGWVMWMMANP